MRHRFSWVDAIVDIAGGIPAAAALDHRGEIGVVGQAGETPGGLGRGRGGHLQLEKVHALGQALLQDHFGHQAGKMRRGGKIDVL